MAQSFPYTYYSCPCVDASSSSSSAQHSKRTSQYSNHGHDEDEERTFDPRSPRANYSLYPIDHLLYCQDCHQLRCPRCVVEEVIAWFCPTCLFEVPSSSVKTEGNRCQRSCFNCPICTAPLTVHSLNDEQKQHLKPEDDPTKPPKPAGPFYQQCPYCQWTSLDIGIEFKDQKNITDQLARIQNGGKIVPTLREKEKRRDKRREAEENDPRVLISDDDQPQQNPQQDKSSSPDHDELFSNLNAFYKSQAMAEAPDGGHGYNEFNLYGQSSLSRIMSIYGNPGGKKSKKDKPKMMREAYGTEEGIQVYDPSAEEDIIQRMQRATWDDTVNAEQRQSQPDQNTRFLSDIRPVQTLLRTKRARRCRTCRHYVARPENKAHSLRYKIKLLAVNNIPSITLRSLAPTSAPSTPGSSVQTQFNYDKLQPLMAIPYLLTIRNPLFDPIKVTLATPAVTPGRIATKVTVLCPEFEVGANADQWEDALEGNAAQPQRRAQPPSSTDLGASNPALQAEAGKVWERGRNWTSVILEVVPDRAESSELEGGLDEDEDVVEIPVFVRIEYETEPPADDDRERDKAQVKGGSAKVKREEAFWCVLGAGRIGPLPKLG